MMHASTSRPPVPATRRVTFHHRGFELVMRCTDGRFGPDSYGYTILHQGDILHQSGGEFGSAEAADRAARRLIDDALGAFDYATRATDLSDATDC